jgi:CheY-like chemotaxis protein
MALAVAPPWAAPASAVSPLRVLVVDDCPVNQLLAGTLLARWGIRPILASEGAQAVRLAAEAAFDLILMDVDMPVMNGLEATARIRGFDAARATHRGVPVVAYTGGPFPSDDRELRMSGMDAVLHKPCAAGEMAACLQRLCPERFTARG